MSIPIQDMVGITKFDIIDRHSGATVGTAVLHSPQFARQSSCNTGDKESKVSVTDLDNLEVLLHDDVSEVAVDEDNKDVDSDNSREEGMEKEVVDDSKDETSNMETSSDSEMAEITHCDGVPLSSVQQPSPAAGDARNQVEEVTMSAMSSRSRMSTEEITVRSFLGEVAMNVVSAIDEEMVRRFLDDMLTFVEESQRIRSNGSTVRCSN